MGVHHRDDQFQRGGWDGLEGELHHEGVFSAACPRISRPRLDEAPVLARLRLPHHITQILGKGRWKGPIVARAGELVIILVENTNLPQRFHRHHLA